MNDTFGMALMDYFNNPTSIHILERDDGYINEIETKSYYKEYNEWHPIEQKLAKLAKGKILDVGCGSGRSLKYFQKKGLETHGIDISELAIEASKRMGVKNCVVMDVLKLDFPADSFDAVTLLGNGLGLCGYEGSKKMLKHLSKVVKPNGVIYASSRDPSITDNPKHHAYHERNRKQGKTIGLVNLRVNFNDVMGDWFEFYMIEPKDIADFIKDTGWSIERNVATDDPGDPIYGVILKNTD